MGANVTSFLDGHENTINLISSVFCILFLLFNHIQLSIKYRKLVIVVQYYQIVVFKVKTSLTIFKITSFSTKKVHSGIILASKIKLFESCNHSCIQFMARCFQKKIPFLRLFYFYKWSKIFFTALISGTSAFPLGLEFIYFKNVYDNV